MTCVVGSYLISLLFLVAKSKRAWAHLDNISPNDLSLPPPLCRPLSLAYHFPSARAHLSTGNSPTLTPLFPPSRQKPMLDLLIRLERLRNLESGEIPPQERSDLGDVLLLHLAETGKGRGGGDRELLDEAGDGHGPREGGESDIDQFGRVEVAVVVSM